MEEKKTIIEVIKENKGSIVKRALIIAGTIGGLILAAKVFNNDDDYEMIELDENNSDADFSGNEAE